MAALKLWELSPRHLALLTYPAADFEEARKRLVELHMLGVESLVFEGGTELWGLRVVAKGTTSVVVKGLRLGEEVAVKVRRVDANRPSLLQEAERLWIANSVGVGPRLLSASRNLLVWAYVEGTPIEEWIPSASLGEVREVVRKLLLQAAALDRVGLVHKELSRLGSHVLVTPQLEPVIFDLETASAESRKSNVTQVAQGLLVRESELAERVQRALEVAREEALEILREYKRSRGMEVLQRLLG